MGQNCSRIPVLNRAASTTEKRDNPAGSPPEDACPRHILDSMNVINDYKEKSSTNKYKFLSPCRVLGVPHCVTILP